MQLLSNDLYLQSGYRELMESGRDYSEIFNLERSQDEFLNDIG